MTRTYFALEVGDIVHVGTESPLTWTVEAFLPPVQGDDRSRARLRSGLTDRHRIEPINRLRLFKFRHEATLTEGLQ